MVRAIVGTLLEIGLKKKTLKNLEYILKVEIVPWPDFQFQQRFVSY